MTELAPDWPRRSTASRVGAAILAAIGCLSWSLVWFPMVFLLPRFVQIFEDMNVEVPALTCRARLAFGTILALATAWILAMFSLAFAFLCPLVASATIPLSPGRTRTPRRRGRWHGVERLGEGAIRGKIAAATEG